MHLKEYRICMPLSVEEYRIGQLYMITKHSDEQSEDGEGVEVVKNEACEDPVHGNGQFTEKRIYLSSRLPSWIRSLIPRIFYITEKAWNYYPYTKTEYTCSFMPNYTVNIETRYKDDDGSSENVLGLSDEELKTREVEVIDIAHDEFPERHYKESEDPTLFLSKKTGRGQLKQEWKSIRDVLLIGHRQAFTWIDEWIDMKMEDIRNYESSMHKKTNEKVVGT